MAEEYLILHGWQNRRPEGHWQRWLAGELAARGATVRYPQLPEPDVPVLTEWLDALERELDGTDPYSLTVVCHSLGCLLWFAYAALRAERGDEAPVARRVILAAPPAGEVVRGIPEIAAFAPSLPPDACAHALGTTSIARIVVLGGDFDPFCPDGANRTYAIPLGLEFIEIEGGGHLTMDDGFGPFPLVLDLATR